MLIREIKVDAHIRINKGAQVRGQKPQGQDWGQKKGKINSEQEGMAHSLISGLLFPKSIKSESAELRINCTYRMMGYIKQIYFM
jgi:hypothetical protein